jgi:hypothetical protein
LSGFEFAIHDEQPSNSKLLVFCLSLLGLFPLALFWINDSWVFPTPAGWIDPYVYTGYFFNLRQFLNVFANTYYGARLPWLLLGFLVHHVFSPVPATYVLRLVLIYASSFSLFVILYLLFNNAIGSAVAAMLLSAHSYFLWAVGWDYVDGVGIGLILMSVAGLTVAARTKYKRPALILAGVCQFGMVSTYIMLLLLIPFQLWWYISLSRERQKRLWLTSAAYLFGGWSIALILLGTVNYAVSGHFLFFLPQMKAALQIGGNPGRWKAVNYGWVANATWLLFPAISVTAGMITWLALRISQGARKRCGKRLDEVNLCAAQLVLLALLFLAMEIKGFWLLQLSFYADYLIPAVFILIGSALAVAFTASKPLRGVPWVIGAAVILLSSYAYGNLRRLDLCAPYCHVPGRLSLLGLGAATLLALAILLRNRWVAILAFLLMVPTNLAIADGRIFSFPASAVNRSRALMVDDGILVVRQYNRGGDLLFWYDVSEPLGGVFKGISSGYLWGYRLISEHFPKRTNPVSAGDTTLSPDNQIALLSTRRDVFPILQKSLEASCLQAQDLAEQEIHRGTESFRITIVRIDPVQGAGDESIPLNIALSANPTAQVNIEKERVVVRTPSIPWAYAAKFPMPQSIRQGHNEGPAYIRLGIRTSGGPVGIGALNTTGTEFVARVEATPSEATSNITLSVPRLDEVSSVIVQTWESGVSATVDVLSMRVLPNSCQAVQ